MGIEDDMAVEQQERSGTGGPAEAFGRPGGARPPRKRRRVAALVLILAIAGGIYGGYWYIWSLTHESTDDAQAEGNIYPMSSQVAGYVAERLVTDNQVVSAGDVLVRIRTDDFEARVRLAEAQLAAAESDVKVAEHDLAVLRQTTAASIDQAHAGVKQAVARLEAATKGTESFEAKLTAQIAALHQAEAQVRVAQADLDYATFNQDRIARLRENHEAAEDETQLAEMSYKSAQAKLAAAKAGVNLAEAQVNSERSVVEASRAGVTLTAAQIEQEKAKVESALSGPNQVRVAEAKVELARAKQQAAKAQLELARIELGYCTIRAPVRGVISKRTVEVGQFLQPGQPFLAVVPLEDTWVTANYKETQLREMRVGQPARLDVDAYPDHPFRGYVQSIAAGTGARFSILPPENATGNYVKIVQRVPVKIVLAPGEHDPQRPLRLGMNVVVTVDTGKEPTTTAPAR
jgi:membrane fusion protein (multidrug efflux system)